MKKLLLALLIAFSVLTLASCSLDGLGNLGNGGNNNSNTSKNGKSAYELYVEKFGYEGTEEQWLSDLINGKLVTDYHEHTFGDWINYSGNANVDCENRLFYRICTECKVIEWQSGSYDSHDFDVVTTEPTCQAGGYDTKTCTICGKVEVVNETPIADHTWKSEYSYDNSFHWYDCENCASTKAYAEHIIDDTGYCTVCAAPVGSTVGVTYEISLDGTYAEVIGYSGSATKIVFADTYEDLPVKSIYKEAFKNTTIVSIVIPDSITMIGESAFSNCDSLTSVVIGNGVENIPYRAFYGCDALRSVVIPDSVTSIGDFAFSSCSSLASVTIPDSVTSIGSDAFYGCYRLASVAIGNGVEIISTGAFYDCDSLTSVVIPNSVTSIGSFAFWYCNNLTSVVIGDSVEIIGSQAFHYCPNLTSVTIGNSSALIGSSAFSDCNSSLYTEYEYGRYVGDAENPYAILIGLTNKNLRTYKIHEDTKLIACGVFSGCERLAEITIPDSVTSIGERAFYSCASLTSVVIGDSVTSIGSSAFNNCSSLTSVYISDIATWCNISFDGYDTNPLYYANNLYLNEGLITELVIPDSVESIGERAFYYCSKITSVVIPDSVTSIGSSAFYECDSLTSVVIGDSVTSIGDYAFYDCDSLTSVVIGDSVTSIGNYAFFDCYRLTSIKYRGTEEEWNAITKGSDWDRWTGNYTITYNYDGE